MNLKVYISGLIAYLLVGSGMLNGQQYVSLQLLNGGSDNHIIVDDESLIKEGNATEDSVFLEEDNAEQDVHLHFDILNGYDASDEFFVALKDPSTGDIYSYQVEDGDISIQDAFGSIALGTTTLGQYSLNIIRCNGFVFYVHENNVIACREIGEDEPQLNALVNVFEAVNTDIEVAIEEPVDCDYLCKQIEENYIALEHFIEWREHVITVPEIRFKYVEQYAISEENEVITCRLWNNTDGSEAESPTTFPNTYGINLHTWALSVDPGAVYILEVSGMNKGASHRIKIRYDE